MNDENVSVDQDLARAKRIIALMPVLEERYRNLCILLDRSPVGEDVDEAKLWLVQGDLQSVINAMTGNGFIDDEE